MARFVNCAEIADVYELSLLANSLFMYLSTSMLQKHGYKCDASNLPEESDTQIMWIGQMYMSGFVDMHTDKCINYFSGIGQFISDKCRFESCKQINFG